MLDGLGDLDLLPEVLTKEHFDAFFGTCNRDKARHFLSIRDRGRNYSPRSVYVEVPSERDELHRYAQTLSFMCTGWTVACYSKPNTASNVLFAVVQRQIRANKASLVI